MVQLRDDCFNNDGKLLQANEAIEILSNCVHPIINTEVKELRHSLGRIIAEDIISKMNVPPHDNSAVDGFAVNYRVEWTAAQQGGCVRNVSNRWALQIKGGAGVAAQPGIDSRVGSGTLLRHKLRESGQ